MAETESVLPTVTPAEDLAPGKAAAASNADAPLGDAEAPATDGVEESKGSTVTPPPAAVQLVDVSADGDRFDLNEDALLDVLSKVPPGMKVSVLAVVGAYRTGKSFLLDIILRYLQYCEDHPDYDYAAEPEDAHGNSAWFQAHKTVGGAPAGGDAEEAGFKWRPGRERMTTGIWIWNKHFVRTIPGTGEKVAIIVADTQGMFDSKTSQQLTTSIFGLSTLISSYLVYNVSMQIQEDNLQHLALFSEYGRVVLQGVRAAMADQGVEIETPHPFQSVEFLVRDAVLDGDTVDESIAEMGAHLEKIMSVDTPDDLRRTRDQLRECFQDVRCFMLPHPGYDVSEQKLYDGAVEKIRLKFRTLVEAYVYRLFGERLTTKRIHGRDVTARELHHFVIEYAKLFKQATVFPKAESLLEATATANNRAATDKALAAYKREMDDKAGPRCGYVAPVELKKHHQACKAAALQTFDSLANFGPNHLRQEQRRFLTEKIEDSWARYEALNKSRDPWRNMELYLVAGIIGIAAYVLRVISDSTCGGMSQICSSASDFFSMIYVVLFSLIGLSALVTWRALYKRVRTLISFFVAAAGTSPSSAGATHEKQD